MNRAWIVVLAMALTSQSGIVGQAPPAQAAQPADMPGRDWPYHGGDPGGMRYSTLAQVNPDNVKTLKRAWVFKTGHTAGTFETTPLVIDSVVYITAPNGVFALDAVTGKEIWRYAPVGPDGNALGASTRGVQYWPGSGGLAPRLFTRTANGLTALAMATGEPVSSFGENGIVPNTGTSTSPPSIFRDVVMIQDNGPNVQALRRTDGPQAVADGAHRAARRFEPRHLAEQQREHGGRWHGCLGHHVARCRARSALCSRVESRQRLLGRAASRQQPLLGLHRRDRCDDRQDGLVFPDGPSRHLGLRSRRGAVARRGASRRSSDSGRRANHEDGTALRAAPRDRAAHLWRRGTASAPDESARRVDIADAAVPTEASAARAHEHDEGGARRRWEDLARARDVLPRLVGTAQRR